MPDELTINHSAGIIEIRSYGAVSKEDIGSSMSEIQRVRENDGLDRVLVDATEQDSMPRTFDIFDLFSTFPRNIRCAIIVVKKQHNFPDLRFAETVSVNNNVDLRLFETRESAIDWLK